MGKKVKLNQVVAARSRVQPQAEAKLIELAKKCRNEALFKGFSRVFSPLTSEDNQGGFVYPPEKQLVQANAKDVIAEASNLFVNLLDVNASNEYGNQQANADVTVDGKVLIKAAPVSFLMYLEKKLKDVKDIVEALPTNDLADEWNDDSNTGLWRTEIDRKHKTKKVPRVIQLTAATDKHAPTATLQNEDIVEGTWDTTKFSGGIPQADKKKYLSRVEDLFVAVKKAREEANMVEVTESEVSKSLLSFVFN